MTLSELKLLLQSHLSDGLVTIVGSGLSCAEGLPSMGALASELEAKVGPGLSTPAASLWKTILPLIRAKGLEAALLEVPASEELEETIRGIVVATVSQAERAVISEVFNGIRILRLTKLIKRLLRPPSGVQFVTTNYDRLIEVAAEEAGLGVDTMFLGTFAGALNERECRLGFCRNVELKQKTARFVYTNRLVISKPHGSLDWYQRGTSPVRHSGDLVDATRLVIPPGQNKFRSGYGPPFDAHRERANKEIDKATRFLIVGYGFNDDHLETHLRPRLRSGIPTVIVTHSLSPNALKLLSSHPHVVGIESDAASNGTKVHTFGVTDIFAGKELWDLGIMIDEVFPI